MARFLMHRKFTALEQPVSALLTKRASLAPCFVRAACVHLPFKARERSGCTQPRSGAAHSWKCQTATATPAEPGELPLH